MIGDSVAELTTRVEQLSWESDGVVSVQLVDPMRRALPGWEPGAHIDLVLPNGAERQYSLCGSPNDLASYRIAILREESGRGGSSFIHDSLRPGALVTIRGPRNNFKFEVSPSILFVAGGIGITPLIPMIEAAEEAGADWHLLYGGRQRASMAFLNQLARHGSRVAVAAQDEVGLLDLDSWVNGAADGTRIYCCGPEALIAAVEAKCETHPSVTLHVERFAARPVVALSDGADNAFTVRCQRSATEVKVAADQSILEALRDAGMTLPNSCQEGVCGTCETRVIDGPVDHRDSILSPSERAENESMMICVSRAQGDLLVLDL